MGNMRRVAGAGSAVCLALSVAGPAAGDGATVTRGGFSSLAGAVDRPEEDMEGRARLVRTADGRTHLSVTLSGLQPDVTYGVHLHNAPCSATNPGGGHYKHDSTGPGRPPNELWASSTPHDPLAGIESNAAGNASGNGTADWVAGANAVSVVIHAGLGHGATTTAGGPKLACADLS